MRVWISLSLIPLAWSFVEGLENDRAWDGRCAVPLSPYTNGTSSAGSRNLIVNDDRDGRTKVRIKVGEVSQDLKGEIASVKVKIEAFEPEWQWICLGIWSEHRTVVEECSEQNGEPGDREVVFDIDLRKLGLVKSNRNELVVNSFVRSRRSNHVLAIDFNVLVPEPVSDLVPDVDLLVMSKDRPFEVEALLDSLYRFCVGYNTVFVLWASTTECTERGYETVALRYPWISFLRETDFRNDTLRIVNSMSKAKYIMPMVGEMVFIRKFNFKTALKSLQRFSSRAVMHLRLGTQLKLFQALEREFGPKFVIGHVGDDGEFIVYDPTVAQQNICFGRNEQDWVLNDFWWINHLGGSIVRRDIVIDTWSNLVFSHPGTLEVNWGYAGRSRSGALQLMPMKTVLVSNDNAPPTRKDHRMDDHHGDKLGEWLDRELHSCRLLFGGDPIKGSESFTCLPKVDDIYLMATMDHTFPAQVRTYFPLQDHCSI